MPLLTITETEQLEWFDKLEANPEDLVKYWFRDRLTEAGFNHAKAIERQDLSNGDIIYIQ